jgi:hypothetical protein
MKFIQVLKLIIDTINFINEHLNDKRIRIYHSLGILADYNTNNDRRIIKLRN